MVVENVVESNDSSQLMSTRHTGSRFARQLRKYSASNYEGRLEMLSNQLDSTRIERLVTVDVNLSYRKSICKTLQNFPQVTAKGVADFVQSTRFEPLVTVDVDLSYRKSICKTTLLMTSRVDPCDWSRFVYIEYPNLTLKYVLSSFANRLLVRRIYCTYD